MVFIGTGNTYEAPEAPLSDSLLVLDLDSGAVIWSQKFTEGDVMPGVGGLEADVGATPNLFRIPVDGTPTDVVGVGSKAGLYRVFRREDGEPIWTTQLTIGDTGLLGGIMGSAAVGGGAIYVNSNTWQEWPYQFLFTGVNNPADTSITYALDAVTGEVLWSADMPAPNYGPLTKVNDIIFHPLLDGRVVGLSATDGTVVFDEQLGGPAGSGVTASNGYLHFAYGFNQASSPPVIDPNTGVPSYEAGVRTYVMRPRN